MAYLGYLDDLDESHFSPNYDPSSTSQSSNGDDWIVLDETGSDHSSHTPGPVADSQEQPTAGDHLPLETASAAVLDDATRMSVSRASCSDTSQARSRGYRCPVCGIGLSGHVKRHVLRSHLPWYWIGSLSCWECRQLEGSALSLTVKHTMAHKGQQRSFDDDNLHEWCQLFNGSLHLLREWFGAEDLKDLLQLLATQIDIPGGEFTVPEHQLMTFYSAHYSDSQPCHYTISPVNHIVCVLHWQVISTILKSQTFERQDTFKNHQCRLLTSGMTVDKPIILEEPISIVDSHFHLDKVLQRSNYLNWPQLQDALQGRSHVDLAIANYVFPRGWDNWEREVSSSPNLKVSFGIHPHSVCDAHMEILSRFAELANLPQCCAIGEIGIDLTSECSCNPCHNPRDCQRKRLGKQLDFLAEMLLMARTLDKPVILHCRDKGTGEAAEHTLSTIRMMDMSDHAFHRHCFTGELEELRQWQRELTNVKFGVTMKSIQDPRMVALIPPEQLLLETDAPYLPPAPGCRLNHPWNILSLAKQVSFIRNMPASLLLKITNANAKEIYSHGVH